MINIKKYDEFNEEVNIRKGLIAATLGAGLSFTSPVKSQTINPQSIKVSDVIKEPVNTYNTSSYDSTFNYIPPVRDLNKLINQVLFLKPLDRYEIKDKTSRQASTFKNIPIKSRKDSRNFYKDYKSGGFIDVSPVKVDEVDNLYGKYFNVLDVIFRVGIGHSKFKVDGDFLSSISIKNNPNYSSILKSMKSDGMSVFLKLEEIDSKEVYYYGGFLTSFFSHSSRTPTFSNWGFIIDGFYIKQTDLLKGCELVVKEYNDKSGKYVDIIDKTGNLISETSYSDGVTTFITDDNGNTKKVESEDWKKYKVGTKFKFLGLIVDTNQKGSPLCLEFDVDGKKVLVNYNKIKLK